MYPVYQRGLYAHVFHCTLILCLIAGQRSVAFGTSPTNGSNNHERATAAVINMTVAPFAEPVAALGGMLDYAIVGDVNCDGIPDLGARLLGNGPDGEDEYVIVSGVDGSDLLLLRGMFAGDGFASGVEARHDVSGDGIADVIVGMPNDGAGVVAIFHGPFVGGMPEALTISNASMVLTPSATTTQSFGRDVAVFGPSGCVGEEYVRVSGIYLNETGEAEPSTWVINARTGDGVYRVLDGGPFDAWGRFPTDINDDGVVDDADVFAVESDLFRPRHQRWYDSDINGDGRVTNVDLERVRSQLGSVWHEVLVQGECELDCGEAIPPFMQCVATCEGTPVLVPFGVHFDCASYDMCGGMVCNICLTRGCMQGFGTEVVPEYTRVGDTVTFTAETSPPFGDVQWWLFGRDDRFIDLGQQMGDTGEEWTVELTIHGRAWVFVGWWNCYSCFDNAIFWVYPPVDTDGDGLPDFIELEWGLDPFDPDSDDDGTPDGEEDSDMDGTLDTFEYYNGTDPHDATSGSQTDNDNDGVPDSCELVMGTNPSHPDSDGDGISDLHEDSDDDGLSDPMEMCVWNTDPTYYDSDRDGLPDGWEVRYGSDPLNSDTDDDGQADCYEDFDYDGVHNFDEWLYQIDPHSADSDGDGVDDATEIEQGSNPADASDGGVAPPDSTLADFQVIVGDPSDSESEIWMMTLGRYRIAAPGFGSVIERTIRLPLGEDYEFRIQHLGSLSTVPDYDYVASIVCESTDACCVVDDPFGVLCPPPTFCNNVDVEYLESHGGWIYLPLVDLDIDSTNNSGPGQLPARSEADDNFEDDPTAPGKLLPVNNDDEDADGIPGFADGFNFDGIVGNSDDVLSAFSFTPVVLEYREEGRPTEADIQITYDFSDPLQMQQDGGTFTPGPGRYRLWLADASTIRSSNSLDHHSSPGDLVPPGSYPASAFGLDDQNSTVVLYLESVEVSSRNDEDVIEISVDGHAGPCEDRVRTRAFDLALVSWDEATGSEHPAPTVAGPADLRPELSIELVDTHLTADGNLSVTVQGHVRDRLSELADDPAERLQDVRFFANGTLIDVLDNLPALSPGAGVMPWQPHLLDVHFTRTFIISMGGNGVTRPRGIRLLAITGENGAGHRARDSIHLGVEWTFLEDIFGSSFDNVADPRLNLFFPLEPTPESSDMAFVYFGDRPAFVGDGEVFEDADEPASWQFSGHINSFADLTTIPCEVLIDDPQPFEVDAIDSFSATVTYTLFDDATFSSTTTFTETAANSRRFMQDVVVSPQAFQLGHGADASWILPRIVLARDVDVEPEGDPRYLERHLMRVTGLDDDSLQIMHGFVNGHQKLLRPFAFSPVRYYVIRSVDEDSKPTVYVISDEDLPPGLRDSLPEDLTISDDVLYEYFTSVDRHVSWASVVEKMELFEGEYGPDPEEPGEEPDGPVTLPEVLTFFQFMFGPDAMYMLEAFENAGGLISFEDEWGDLDVGVDNGIPYIIVEEDLAPWDAANLLLVGLRQSLGTREVIRQLDPSTQHGVDLIIKSLRVRGELAASATAAVANAYLAGLSMVNEGADWVFTVHELSEGHWEAAVGFIPFVPAAVTQTPRIVLRAGGEVAGVIDQRMINAVKTAATKKYFKTKWRIMAKAGMTPEQARIFVRAGIIRPNKSRAGLRNAMETTGVEIPPNIIDPQAHHELPWKFRDQFLQWGFEVNNPRYGKWVEAKPHADWSNQLNDEWELVLNSINDAGLSLEEGHSIILQAIDDFRLQNGPGGDFPFTYE